MPSALWTYYDRELWRAVRMANAAGDVDRLTTLLGHAQQFERLIALIGDEPRLDEVRRDGRWLMHRILELSLARDTADRG
jgi:DNA-binding GntR family transcriptional regulator